jgi:membrane-associated protease RseP (regulator of RpoE activity)
LIELLDADARSLKVEGFTQRRRAWLGALALGDTIHKRIGVHDGNESALGLCFLSRYAATFDFPNQRLYLRPARWIAEPDRFDLNGLHIWRRDPDGVEIATVDPMSPGSAAGLKAGDRILKCDGERVSSTRLFQLRMILATGGFRTLEVDGPAGQRNVMLDLARPKTETARKSATK